MSRRRILMLALFCFALPSFSLAISMGDIGGMVDKVFLQTKTVGKVVFSHGVHGTKCDQCHPKLFEKKRSSTPVSMKAMERGKSCGACHNGKKAFSVTANCTTCHAGDILYVEKDAGNVKFSHEVHTGLFGCDACHPDLFKAQRGANRATMEQMEKGESCGACHDGSTAFNVADECQACHEM